MKLKLLAVSLVLLLIVCFAWGCSGGETPVETTPETSESVAETVETSV